MVESEYRGVSVKRALLDEVDEYVETHPKYTSTSAFVSEAIRLRLEQVKAQEG